ncbi:hypothetical protein TL16_g12646 [Triparma laevis f. inornata]|uniref:EGF-like domain-containing protein n=1 Tax=Triparma laevis f. inornata TaxID=1714386 RepID=A0A9W7EXJ9_9STRA|nr:hypothetical protein TL16_g12646 [Triparma laevis f. inornata]
MNHLFLLLLIILITHVLSSCPDGQRPGVTGVCLLCPSGKAGTSCSLSCPAGKYSLSGAATCTNCPAGKYGRITELVTAECSGNCGQGKYSQAGSTECSDCPLGKYGGPTSTSTGQVTGLTSNTCTGPCPAGKYGDAVGLSACVDCESGKYQDATGSTSPTCSGPCPAGTYSPPGSTICSSCLSGHSGPSLSPSLVGYTVPQCGGKCPAGKYSTEGSTECTQCTAGHYGESAGMTVNTCTGSCQLGRYSGEGEKSCTPCEEGKYSDQVGQASCMECVPGKYGQSIGMTTSFCSGLCPIGTYQPFSGKAECEECIAGKYGTREGAETANRCSPCSTNMYALPGSIICETCKAGYSSEGLAENVAALDEFCGGACPAGKFSLAGGSCTPCPAGKYGMTTASVTAECDGDCSAGKYSGEGGTTCTDCPQGKFGSSEGLASDACDGLCAAGKYSIAGSQSCYDCNPGRFGSDGDIAATCTGACAAGYYGSGGDSSASTCLDQCPKGKYSEEGASSCTNCPAGTSGGGDALRTTNECNGLCGVGKFSTDAWDQELECEDCPARSYSATTGSSSCLRCPNEQQATVVDLEGLTSEAELVCRECKCPVGNTCVLVSGTEPTCTACDAGTYGPSVGSEVCLPCPEGTQQKETGRPNCEVCPTGQVPDESKIGCNACEAGKFALPGQISCTECPVGKASEARKDKCEYCGPGNYVNKVTWKCESCAKGKYSVGDVDDCTDCESGKVQTKEQGTYCTVCDTGQEPNAEKTECNSCVSGKYASYGATSCDECDAGKYAETKALQCTQVGPGKIVTEVSGLRVGETNCQAGKFSAAEQIAAEQCEDCAEGKFSNSGAISCITCQPGRFQATTATGSFECQNCPTGKVRKEDQTSCDYCDESSGLVSIADNRVSCLLCAAGKYADVVDNGGGRTDNGCTNCASGKFSSGGTQSCDPCGENTYSTASDTSEAGPKSCQTCPAGEETKTDQTGCQGCVDGEVSQAGGRCAPCLAGTHQSGLVCEACKDGKFVGSEKMTACEMCEDGKSSQQGATECTACEAGTSSTGGERCATCEPGTYSGSASTSCSSCDAGTWSGTKAEKCTNCNAGKFEEDNTCKACAAGKRSDEGKAECDVDCPTGTFGERGSATCTSCAAGRYSNVVGKSSCDYCVAGKFSESAGSVTCQDCAVGKYSPSSATSCDDCRDGWYAGTGAASCSICVAGKSSTADSSACTECAKGKFSPAESTDCSDCEAGFVAPVEGTSSCQYCEAGKYAKGVDLACDGCAMGKYSSGGAQQCTDCEANTYTDQVGEKVCNTCANGQDVNADSTGCVTCENGSESSAGSDCSSCGPGYFSTGGQFCSVCEGGKRATSGSADCTDCVAGKYSTSGSSLCENCPGGTHSGAGSASCVFCTEGKFSPNPEPGTGATGASECDDCPAGSISSIGASECIKCAAGKFEQNNACEACAAGTVSLEGSTSCDDSCPAGTYGELGGATCQACSEGKFSGEGQGSCELCAAGKYSEEGATACIECAVGRYSGMGRAENHDPAPEDGLPCDKCGPGHVSTSGSAGCTTCEAGTVPDEDSGDCRPCEVGKKSSVGSTECTTCSAGTYAEGVRSNSCAQCALGTYSGEEASSCIDCEAGKITLSSQDGCTDVEAGQYSEAKAASSSKCPAGTRCPKGQEANEDRTECQCKNRFINIWLEGGDNVGELMCICGPGYTMSDNTCSRCSAGTFKEEQGNGPCTPCNDFLLGSFSTTSRGGGEGEEGGEEGGGAEEGTADTLTDSLAVSRYNCTCEKGDFKMDASAMFEELQAVPKDFEENGGYGYCLPCPEGTSCTEKGLVVQTIPVLAGYWRSDFMSYNVVKCRKDVACPQEPVSTIEQWANESGVEVPRNLTADEEEDLLLDASQCEDGHEGPLCDVCKDGYAKSTYSDICQTCNDKEFSVPLPVWILFAVFMFFLFWIIALPLLHKQRKDQRMRSWVSSASSEKVGSNSTDFLGNIKVGNVANFKGATGSRSFRSMQTKFKILMTFYQITGQFESLLVIEFPPLFAGFMRWVSYIFSFHAMKFFSIGCFMKVNFFTKLMVFTVIPFFVAGAIFLFFLFKLTLVRGDEEGMRREKDDLYHRLLFLTYIIFSSVSMTVFQTFNCVTHGDDETKYLFSDSSIDCGTDEYMWYRRYARIMVGVYPFGITMLYTYVLCSRSQELQDPKRVKNKNLDKIRFLWDMYDLDVWWFEIFECIRRLSLTGLLVFLTPGSTSQIIVALVLSLFYCCCLFHFRPYEVDADDDLGNICQLGIFMTVFSCLIMKVEVDETDGYDQKLLGLVLIAVNIAGVFIIVIRFLSKPFKKLLKLLTKKFEHQGGIKGITMDHDDPLAFLDYFERLAISDPEDSGYEKVVKREVVAERMDFEKETGAMLEWRNAEGGGPINEGRVTFKVNLPIDLIEEYLVNPHFEYRKGVAESFKHIQGLKVPAKIILSRSIEDDTLFSIKKSKQRGYIRANVSMKGYLLVPDPESPLFATRVVHVATGNSNSMISDLMARSYIPKSMKLFVKSMLGLEKVVNDMEKLKDKLHQGPEKREHTTRIGRTISKTKDRIRGNSNTDHPEPLKKQGSRKQFVFDQSDDDNHLANLYETEDHKTMRESLEEGKKRVRKRDIVKNKASAASKRVSSLLTGGSGGASGRKWGFGEKSGGLLSGIDEDDGL